MLMRTNEAESLKPLIDRQLRLERRDDGQLWLLRGRLEATVRPVRCYPWTAPASHVSLRDADDEELAYVAAPDTLDEQSRAALLLAMEDAGLVLEIIGVTEIDEDYEIRCWEVMTRQGKRRFQTTLESWPRPVPGGGLLIEDVAGDLYWIADDKQLDAGSQKQLWAYID